VVRKAANANLLLFGHVSTEIHPSRRWSTMAAMTPFSVHVLTRLGYGPRPGDIESFEGLGENDDARLAGWLDQQLAPSDIDDDDLEERLEAANFRSLDLNRREAWTRYYSEPAEDVSGADPFNEVVRATYMRATFSNAGLYEMLVRFWHDHFNVYAGQGLIRSMIAHYDHEVIRPFALGNFRELLGEVAQSTSMLSYLDNYVSTSAGPNENWARELFELHTMGAENYLGAGIRQEEVEGHPDQPVGYVDDDVYEATRCFTGWSFDTQQGNDTGRFLYNREDHDRFQKSVLGTFLPADQRDMRDGEQVLDLLAAHPGTGRHVCRKLCRRFIADNPADEIVASAAEIFTSNVDDPDQIAKVVRHIAESAAFKEAPAAKIKRPYEFTISMLRATGAEVQFSIDDSVSDTFIFVSRGLGHEPFGWPAPDGYPDTADYWLNTTSLFRRWDLVNLVVADTQDDFFRRPLLRQQAGDQEPQTAAEIVDFWYERLLHRDAEPEARRLLIDFMGQGFNENFPLGNSDGTDERTRALVALILMSPEFQWR